jgi:antitoxin VapB
MGLNIKDQETHDLVKELAGLKGMSLTGAVKDAIRQAIEREKASLSGSEGTKMRKRSEVLQAFAHDFVSRVKPPADLHSWDVDKYLYDEHGLPK